MLLTQSQLSIADSLFDCAERQTGITAEQIKSKSRKQELVYVRVAFCKALRETGWSLGKIGKILDRDHSTIIHSLNSFERMKYTSENGDFPKEGNVVELVSKFIAHLNLSNQIVRETQVAKRITATAMQSMGCSLYSIIGVCR